MPEVMFIGEKGRIEGRWHPGKSRNAPIAIILHPHPQFGGTMNNPVVYHLYYTFANRGFGAAFQFSRRRPQPGQLRPRPRRTSDAAAALDWAQATNPDARACWIAGVSFGAWIGMQLLMRRPEVEGFISVAAPASLYDFSFLAPCPSSGLFVHGDKDAVVPTTAVAQLVEKLKTQKGIVIEQQLVRGANHFFDGKVEPLMEVVGDYLDKRLPKQRESAA